MISSRKLTRDKILRFVWKIFINSIVLITGYGYPGYGGYYGGLGGYRGGYYGGYGGYGGLYH